MSIRVTPETTIGDLYNDPRMGAYHRFLFSVMNEPTMVRTLDNLGFEKCAMQQTVDRLEEMAAAGMDTPIPLYTPEEIAAVPSREKAELLFFPAGEGKPCMLICPGGAYAREWGLVEGLSIAVALNRLGYPALVLFYRTKNDPPFDEPVLPDALEDLARAVRYLTTHAAELHISPDSYSVSGFSAGAHLAAEWGTVNHGWRTQGLPAPAALLLCYPPVDLAAFLDGMGTDLADRTNGANYFMYRVGGYGVTREVLEDYSPSRHMDADYPPTCVYACEDDGTVPVAQGKLMLQRLEELGIRHDGIIGARGGHSFGLGLGTDVAGWLPHALHFWRPAGPAVGSDL